MLPKLSAFNNLPGVIQIFSTEKICITCITVNKIECSWQAKLGLNTSAWNNRIGLPVLFCWFLEPK